MQLDRTNVFGCIYHEVGMKYKAVNFLCCPRENLSEFYAIIELCK